jgi:5-oxoprolinase (ATP-hydrolysing)
MPISIPVIEMIEIGAGGGSIAWVDAMARIQTGPESAASEPGPACYQRGGQRPAITDADLVLGKIDPENFAGGAIRLSLDAAQAAIARDVGDRLALTAEAAAFGICEVVDENMANAARVHAVENGKDIADNIMVAFGGAAPLHAARLCEKLGIDRCLIPPGAGVGSAIGFLKAPFGYEALASRIIGLADFDPAAVNALLDGLKATAEGFVRQGTAARIRCEVTAFMRYRGQGWEIPVPLPVRPFTAADAGLIRAWFLAAYAGFFGRAIDGLSGLEIEIVTLSVKASDERPAPERHTLTLGRDAAPVPLLPRGLRSGAGRGLAHCHRRARHAAPRHARQRPGGDRGAGNLDHRHLALRCGDAGGRQPSPDPQRSSAMSGPTPDPTGEIRLQVMWNRLISVVEEQAMTLLRTAFSTSVREAGDLSAGVFDPEGRMLAQAVTGTPGHVNTMAEAVLHFIAEIGRDAMFPGDTYVTNDPWKGTGHLHDITMVSPSFLGDRLVGFFACTAHVVDVGGRGFGADGKSVYEEGLQIPILKFAERGVVNRILVQMLRANVREPDQVVGDFYSLAACNDVGHRRLIAMMEEIGLTSLEGLGSFIFSRTAAAMLERIAALPKAAAGRTRC